MDDRSRSSDGKSRMRPESGGPGAGPPTGLYFCVGLVSAAVLAYEILLMRMFSIAHWHHFAYIIISLALLGYGVSGTLITLARERARARPASWLSANAMAFGLTALPAYALAMRVPFNGLEIIWNPGQIGWLTLLYSLLAIPFLFAASFVGSALSFYPDKAPRLYGWDLAGAGLGVIVVIVAMLWIAPQWSLKCAALAGVATGIYLRTAHRTPSRIQGVLLCAVILAIPPGWLAPVVSEFKPLPRTLTVMGATIEHESFSPWGMLTAVGNTTIPLRHAPGLSLAASEEPPPQVAVFTDGAAMTTLTRDSGAEDALRYLEFLPSSLPYTLLSVPDVLVLGAGGGSGVLQARYHGAGHVDAVELNPRLPALVRGKYHDFTGGLYDRPEVHVHTAEARAFLRNSDRRYDLIQVSLLDSIGASSAGARALDENYLYTVEAFGEFLSHLNDHGVIALTRWTRLPPRDSLKLFATARSALEREGASDPGAHLALIRGWQTVTLLISRQPWRQRDLDRIREFAESRRFDLAWLPGMRAAEADRYHRSSGSSLYDDAATLLGPDAGAFHSAYKFNITPATDDRPYFSNFFRWRLLPELLELREQGALVLLDSGYLVLASALAQAIPLAFVLILLPLFLIRRNRRPVRGRVAAMTYFLLLGFGFMFVEMAYLQRFVMYTGHPVFAAAIVLGSFLVFAGLGSSMVPRIRAAARSRGLDVVLPVAACVALLALIDAALLPWVFEYSLGMPFGLRLAIGVAVVAPLAFAMGMPFSLGILRLEHHAPELIPWAWGINGCASVLGSLTTPLLAIHLGFNTVIVVAAALYLGMALLPAGGRDTPGTPGTG